MRGIRAPRAATWRACHIDGTVCMQHLSTAFGCSSILLFDEGENAQEVRHERSDSCR